jgi:hypothetical protein
MELLICYLLYVVSFIFLHLDSQASFSVVI